jgi:hypothetical protein
MSQSRAEQLSPQSILLRGQYLTRRHLTRRAMGRWQGLHQQPMEGAREGWTLPRLLRRPAAFLEFLTSADALPGFAESARLGSARLPFSSLPAALRVHRLASGWSLRLCRSSPGQAPRPYSLASKRACCAALSWPTMSQKRLQLRMLAAERHPNIRCRSQINLRSDSKRNEIAKP